MVGRFLVRSKPAMLLSVANRGIPISRWLFAGVFGLPRWTIPLSNQQQSGISWQEWLQRKVEETTAEKPSIDFFTDNGILLAVPKKKVSHQKKRQKLYGPGKKQLQLMHHLNKCPSCGHYKRANALCMYCVDQVRHIWKAHNKPEVVEPPQERDLSDLDKRVLYPGKKDTEYMTKLKEKDSYLERRMRTLPVEVKK